LIDTKNEKEREQTLYYRLEERNRLGHPGLDLVLRLGQKVHKKLLSKRERNRTRPQKEEVAGVSVPVNTRV